MQPGQQPPACNTRLSVVARNALKPLLGEDQVAEIERQVEAGKLSLADLNSLADKGKDISTGVADARSSASANPQEVALAFLASDRYDAEIEKKAAQNELRHLLPVSFDIDLPAADHARRAAGPAGPARPADRPGRRPRASRCPRRCPRSRWPTSPGGVDACVRLARTWRNAGTCGTATSTAANKVEQEFSPRPARLRPGTLDGDRDLPVRRAGLAAARRERTAARRPTPDLLQLAESRLSRFWAEVMPAIQARWALIASAAEVLLEADRVAQGAQEGPDDGPRPGQSLRRGRRARGACSTRTTATWRAAGTTSSPTPATTITGLEKLITKAEQRYTEVGSELAKHFVTQFRKAKHPIKGLLRQRDIFETQVKPQARRGQGRLRLGRCPAVRDGP